MGVKEQMIEILKSGETSRIVFSYRTDTGSATINGNSFIRIADGLKSGHFNVVEGRHTENKVTYSAWADSVNDTAANTFYLGKNNRWSRDFNALVVHESVHAFFDLTKVTIPWSDNEAVAYIAQGFYLRNSGFPEKRMEIGEPYRIGYLIAGTIAEGGNASSMMTDLRDNLLADPRYEHYITSTFRGDG